MAGVENKIGFFDGIKIQPSSATDIANMQETSTDVAFINYSGNPLGNVAANPASMSFDSTTGNIYLKGNSTDSSAWTNLIPSLGAIQTIEGDNGSVSGTTVQFVAQPWCGSSWQFTPPSAGNIMALECTDTGNNTIVGYSSGNSTVATDTLQNSSLGAQCLSALTSGSFTANVGHQCFQNLTSGSYNSNLGQYGFHALTTGSFNTSAGQGNFFNLVSGSYNTALGYGSGFAYTGSESSNILIANTGVVGESNVARYGTQGTGNGQVSQSYMAGVLNTTSGIVVNTTSPGSYPYTTLYTDYFIFVDTSSAININLIASPVTGTVYIIKDNTGSALINNITITPNAGNIDGSATAVININYGSITLIWNGTQWNVI